jgi:hypothetical protein
LLHILNGEDAEKIQALLCVGLAKLVLAGMISDERVRITVSDTQVVLTTRATGPEESRGSLSLARHGRESRAATMFGVFLPRILLFVEREPEADAPGTWIRLAR